MLEGHMIGPNLLKIPHSAMVNSPDNQIKGNLCFEAAPSQISHLPSRMFDQFQRKGFVPCML